MRVVLTDEQQLQSFFFFPTVPKPEPEELHDDSDSPPPVTAAARSSGRRKRFRTPYDADEVLKSRKSKKKKMKKKKKSEGSSTICKKEEVEEEVLKLPAPSAARIPASRWTEERYRKAEVRLMEIVREKGGVRGRPLLRKELRDEARKHIGDTGLLDHLLKHTVGKVVGGVRFMRRHNPDGAMVYWLEDPEVEEGDGAVCGERCREEIAELKGLVGFLNRDMEKLRSSKETEQSTWQENYEKLLEKNKMLEAKMREMTSSFQCLKKNHASLMNRNIILEGQMAGISNSFKGLKEEIGVFKEEKQKEEEEKNAGEVVEMIEGPMGGSDTEGCDKKNENQQLDMHDLLMLQKTKDGNDNGAGDKMNEKKQLDEHSLPIWSKDFCSPLLRPCDQLHCLEQEQGALEIDIGACSQI